MPAEQPTADDKPFDAEPFDAGVEADESSDPKKFIEQLTGKLGQSLRKYNEDQGQPDFELEKFAINSLLAASHTSEMDPNDQDDIIKKVKEAGNDDNQDDNNDDNQDDSNDSNDGGSDGDTVSGGFGSDMGGGDQGGGDSGSAPVNEEDSIFLEHPKKNNMFQPGSNDILDNDLKESKKSSIFDKIKSKLQETFNQEDEMSEPMVEPAVKPAPVKTPKKEPNIAPSRKNKPFLPMPEVQPDPKAKKMEEEHDFVSQFKGDHHGNPMGKNQYLNSLGLDENGIEILQTFVNLMENDSHWRNKAYPTGTSYVDVIQDIIKVVKNLRDFIAKYKSVNPIKVVNYLKAEILKIKGI